MRLTSRRLKNITKHKKVWLCLVAFIGVLVLGMITLFWNKSEHDLNFRNLLDENTANRKIPMTAVGDPYRIRNPNICSDNPRLEFVVLVHTATMHISRRLVIRNTWALYPQKNKPFEVVFLLGEPQTKVEQLLIEDENAEFGDIVQGKFLDTYYNLTQKAILGIRWVTEHCQQAEHLVKVDDDVVLNVFSLYKTFKTSQERTRTIVCLSVEAGKDEIKRNGKWRTTSFPNLTYYPFPFCRGFFVVITMDIIPELFQASTRMPFFWIDDVYFTGILTKEIGGVTFQKFEYQTTKTKASLQCFYKETHCNTVAAIVNREIYMEYIWQVILQQDIVQAGQFTNISFLRSHLSRVIDIQMYLEVDGLLGPDPLVVVCVFLITIIVCFIVFQLIKDGGCKLSLRSTKCYEIVLSSRCGAEKISQQD